MDLHGEVREFVGKTLAAMGIPLEVEIQEQQDNVRINLSGEGGEILLRRRAEALDALQHVVNTAFRRHLDRDRTFVIDYLDYRRAREQELREMTRFVMEKARSTGTPQEMGPLNPYARRLVHLTVAEDPAMASESIGDAFLKTVIISVRKGP